MGANEEQPGHELVMPFVSLASKGGPFDDAAFTAGYEMGLLDAELAHPYTFGLVYRTLRRENREQADLIAMRHGWRATFNDIESDEWVGAEFLRLDPKLDKPPT
jgi:hypothetical protein